MPITRPRRHMGRTAGLQHAEAGGDAGTNLRSPVPAQGRNAITMLNGLYSAAAGMMAQQTRMDSLANDIANVNTDGLQAAARSASATWSTTRSRGCASAPAPPWSTPAATFAQGALHRTATRSRWRSPAPASSGAPRRRLHRADPRRRLPPRRRRRDRDTASGQRLVPPIRLPDGTSPDDVSIAAGRHRHAPRADVIGRHHARRRARPGRLHADRRHAVPAHRRQRRRRTPADRLAVQQGYLEASNVEPRQGDGRRDRRPARVPAGRRA